MDCKAVGCVIFVCLLGNASSYFTEHYCWRDYDGTIPSDALEAGKDNNGKPVFIAQTLISNKLEPGRLIENVSNNQGFAINETVKILCSDYPWKFQWFETGIDLIPNIKNKHIFEAGYEKGYTTYVGRLITNGNMKISKVICSSNGCNSGVWNNHPKFEILTYKENISLKGSASRSSNYKTEMERKLHFLIFIAVVLVTRPLTY